MKLDKRHTAATLALIALARKIGFRRGRRLAALAADVYLAHQAFRRRRPRLGS
jgi:hypothetical protein